LKDIQIDSLQTTFEFLDTTGFHLINERFKRILYNLFVGVAR